jgi:hypothetical protein
MGVLAEIKTEWRHFRHDRPGQRFCNHRTRMADRPRHHSLLAMIAGTVLLAIGFVLLFMPGPGLVFLVFGITLVASHSQRLSLLLDRTEPRLWRLAHRLRRRYKPLPE